MCCKPVKKKRRRRKGNRVRRRDDPISPEPVEDAGFLDDRDAEEEFAQETFIAEVDRPLNNVIEPIPMPEQVPTTLLHVDTVSYSKSKSADPLPNFSNPKPNRVSQEASNVESEERIITTTIDEVEEEKKNVLDTPYVNVVKPPPVPVVVSAQEYYPARKPSVEKQEEYKLPEREEYRKPKRAKYMEIKRGEPRDHTPEIKKYVAPQKISVIVQETGSIEPKSIATNTSDTVFELRFKIFEKTRILPTNQILVFRTRELPLQKQLGECGIEDRSYIELTDHGKDITEYIIEITDAKTVRQLKSDLRKLEYDLKEAKKRSTDKLRQNEWSDASRLVDNARVLEVKKNKKVEELKEIHEKHKKGFRQLHVKIMRLFSEKRKSSAEYAKLKRDLMVAIQKNEVLRSREIVEKLMIQFIRHDGCERELMLLEAFVPDMVEAAGGTRDDGLEDPRDRETKKTPPPRDINQYEPPVKPYGDITERPRAVPRGQVIYGEDRYYPQSGRYRPSNAYQEPMGPARDQWAEPYYEPQPARQYDRQYEPVPQQFISGGEGDPGAYYH